MESMQGPNKWTEGRKQLYLAALAKGLLRGKRVK